MVVLAGLEKEFSKTTLYDEKTNKKVPVKNVNTRSTYREVIRAGRKAVFENLYKKTVDEKAAQDTLNLNNIRNLYQKAVN